MHPARKPTCLLVPIEPTAKPWKSSRGLRRCSCRTRARYGYAVAWMTRYQYCVGCELMTPFLMALRPRDLSPKTLEHMKRCESMCAACVVCVFSFRILARVYTFRHLCDASVRFFAAEGIRSSFVCSALLAVVAIHCFRGKSSTLPNLFFGAHFRIAIVNLQDILEVTTYAARIFRGC